jgi:hypothetical protein
VKRLRRLWQRLLEWRERRHAAAQLIEETRAPMTIGRRRWGRPCGAYRATGRLEYRDGVLSDFCRTCGYPCGAHHAKEQQA